MQRDDASGTFTRRTLLKGMGAAIALPLLDAMLPAGTALAKALPAKQRLIAIEMVHGAAGSTAFGAKQHLWAPAATGSAFDLTPSALAPLEPYRDYLTIVSNTDVQQRRGVHRARDRRRPLPLGGGVPDPGASQADRRAPTSTPAPRSTRSSPRRFGHETPIPSMQLCIENVDQAGGCFYGYSCAYTDSISWASPTEPLPMIRDPRLVFDQLFGIGATPEARARRRQRDQSLLDFVTSSVDELEARPRRRRPRSGWPTTSTTCARSSGASRRSRRMNSSGEQRDAARRAGRRARLLRRARQADVRPAGAGLRLGPHPRVRLQAEPRRLEPRLSRDRRQHRLPHRLAPRRARGPDHRPGEDQHVPRQPGAVPAREAEEHARRRQRHAARQLAGLLRLADGQPERAQPQALPAVHRRPRRRRAQGQPAHQGRRRHADGQRDAQHAAHLRRRRRRSSATARPRWTSTAWPTTTVERN